MTIKDFLKYLSRKYALQFNRRLSIFLFMTVSCCDHSGVLLFIRSG